MKIELSEVEVRQVKAALELYIEDRKKAAWNFWPLARYEGQVSKDVLNRLTENEEL